MEGGMGLSGGIRQACGEVPFHQGLGGCDGVGQPEAEGSAPGWA